jgi:nucleoside phosphorylase
MSNALKTWKEKLEFLNEELAKCADPVQKFSILKRIDEAREMIAKLGGEVDEEASSQRLPAETPVGERQQPTIGIVTALPQEYVAVEVLLENTSKTFIPGQGGGREYLLGEIPSAYGDRHRVVLSRSGMGTNHAAARATLMLEHFPSVDRIIMTGIAGGIPNPAKPETHVRLGDVVVSNEKGVVQFDSVKLGEVRASPRPPSAALLDAVKSLEAELLKKQIPWKKYIDTAMNTLGWKRPPKSQDVLRETESPDKIVEHPKDPARRGANPRVFQGTIASSNELLKRPAKRDELRDRFGALAVEMEASGIADATWTHETGYLVVRGISDYCDAHKNDDWQKYAAIVAAAFTRALIETMPVQPRNF